MARHSASEATPDSSSPAEGALSVLVVGMHRAGTSATASALGDLGLTLPKAADLLGPSFGNERGHFESRSLMHLSDTVLRALGRAWDDPPELSDTVQPAIEGMVAGARERFEEAFDAPEEPVVWKDPRISLLLPFWRRAIGPSRPIAAMLVTRPPLAVARSLSARSALSLLTSLSLWERYVRHAIAGLSGLPVFVSAFDDSLASPVEWAEQVSEWLQGLGIVLSPGQDRAGAARLDPALRHERAGAGPEPGGGLVLASQIDLHEKLLAMRGPHDAFVPPTVDDESPWVTSHLRQRHDLARLWAGLEYLGDAVTALQPERAPNGPPFHPDGFPKDATTDTEAYHRWLHKRGEAANVGAGHGLVTATTARTGSSHGTPRFTIVVPCYRPPAWALDRCVTSVLTQDYPNWELRIVDDASGDGPLMRQLDRIDRADPRIKVRKRTENGGISAATNEAVSAGSGEWVVFLDHDDELAAGALSRLAAAIFATQRARIIYSDEDKIDESGTRFMPAFKPEWSPDLLLSNAYMCHVLVVKRSLFDQVGGVRTEFDGAQDYDLMLRATELVDPAEIVHIPEVLYHWRTLAGSASGDTGAKPWAFEAGRRAVEEAVRRRGIDAEVTMHPRIAGSYAVRRQVTGRARVSAVIPFRDEPTLLAECYRAFVADPGYADFELLLVDNDSVLPETRAVVAELARDRRVQVIGAPGPFDWVKINNEAVAKASGDMLLFLNNDVEARSPGWLATLVAEAERPEVGAVGARLLYPDGTVQHGGVAVGVCWGAAHTQAGIAGDAPGYLSMPSIVRNVSAVTGACLMTRRDVFEAAGGFDSSLPVAFNDIDYCLRLREKGLLVIYTPLAELVHHESKSRGHSDDARELPYFRRRWRKILLEGDPYYNTNLSRFDSFCRLPNDRDEEQWETYRSILNESSTS